MRDALQLLKTATRSAPAWVAAQLFSKSYYHALDKQLSICAVAHITTIMT